MSETQPMACDACGKIAEGGRVPNGWWRYPDGWFVMESDETSGLVCSEACAQKFDSAREEAKTVKAVLPLGWCECGQPSFPHHADTWGHMPNRTLVHSQDATAPYRAVRKVGP